jgi:hypothetical protein
LPNPRSSLYDCEVVCLWPLLDPPASSARSELSLTEQSPHDVHGTNTRLPNESLLTQQDDVRRLDHGRNNFDDEHSNVTTRSLPNQGDSERSIQDADLGVAGDAMPPKVREITSVHEIDGDASKTRDSNESDSSLLQSSNISNALELEKEMATPENLLIFDAISTAMCSEELQAINLATLCDIEMGPILFLRDVQRLVKIYGQNLHSEARSRVGKCAAIVLQEDDSSAYVAQLIEWRARASVQAPYTEKPLPMPASPKQNAGNTGNDREADILEPLDVTEIQRLLSDTKA